MGTALFSAFWEESAVEDFDRRRREEHEECIGRVCPGIRFWIREDTARPERAAGICAVRKGAAGNRYHGHPMPGGSGTELAERIYRKDGNTAIIFLTAYSELELMKEAIHVSAVDYILKPVSPSELELAIRRAMEKTNSFARKNTALLQEIFFRNLLLDGQRYSGKEYRQIQRELGLPDEKLRYALIVIENLNQEKERTEMDPEYAAFDMTPLGKIIRRGLERFRFATALSIGRTGFWQCAE